MGANNIFWVLRGVIERIAIPDGLQLEAQEVEAKSFHLQERKNTLCLASAGLRFKSIQGFPDAVGRFASQAPQLMD